MRTLRIVTPENIPLSLELAGMGARFLALMVDLLILFSALITLWFVGAIVAGFLQAVGLADMMLAVLLIGTFVIFFGYFLFFETIWNGQTPGKRMLGLRVIQDSGFPITFLSAATRNLIRLVDFLPASFGFGAICVFCHPQYKRLGDLVAGTVVVKERGAQFLRHGPAGPPAAQSRALAKFLLLDTVNDPSVTLTDDELRVFRRFALQRWEMLPGDAERLAYRILAPRLARLNISLPTDRPARYADLVWLIARDADRRQSLRDAQEDAAWPTKR